MRIELKDEDLAFLQGLAAITNVIPLIAQCDAQSPEEIEMLKRSIDKLQDAQISLFTFKSDSSAIPYTVSSASADDNDTMDASTLMSPEYVQPLIPSDLAILVRQVFDPDNIACLRHLAAKKLVHARGSRIFSMPTISPTLTIKSLQDRPSKSPTSLIHSPNLSSEIVPHSSSISPYVQARISDHTQQEEKMAQIRLAKWAGDLQRSLQNERARYEAIARGERAVWLKERLSETANDSALVCTQITAAPQSAVISIPEAGRIVNNRGLWDAGDPLGLFKWDDFMKRRGWTAVRMIGSFGILGAMAVWVARSWGSHSTWQWGWPGERGPPVASSWVLHF